MALGAVIDANADVTAATDAVVACFDTPVSCLSREELSDRLVALSHLETRLHALRVEALHAAELVDVGRLNDQRNAANHTAARTHHDPAEFRAQALLAKWLVHFDVFADAHRAGLLTAAHLHLLRKADNPRVHHQMRADQQRFVDWFTNCQFRDLDEVIDEWLLGADPDGAEPAAHEPDTGLAITPLPGGCSKVIGTLDPLQTAALRGAVEPEANRIQADEKERGSISTVRRRTLHALLNLVGRGTARPDGTFAKPRVNIVMSQRVYEATIAWLADPTVNEFPDIDRTHIDKKCQLIDGTPIHPLYALAATITGTFRRIVYSARGRPIDASYDSRQIPDWMRDISLAATNGKCANPVCDSPFHWLHGDHITPWSHTRDTSVFNTRDLCGGDNGWRSDDITRGIWATSHDWGLDDDELDDNDLILATEQTTIARQRITDLIAAR